MAARKIIHERIVSSAVAGTIVSTVAVPAGRAFVGRFVFAWTSSAVGTADFYAGSNASTSTLIGSPVPIAQGETYEQLVTLLAGEFVSVAVSIANAGGVGTLHLIGEEVDQG